MRFLFPPHPPSSAKILPEDLEDHEKSGRWLAQLKYNGTHVVCWSDGKEADIRDRRGERLATYRLTSAMRAMLCALGKEQEIVCAGELLHTKAKRQDLQEQAVSNTIVLFDILYHGRNLLDITQTQRLELLREVTGDPTELEPKGRAFVVNTLGEANLWFAETFTEEFEYRFYQFLDIQGGIDKFPEIEGLMLRQADSKLDRTGDRIYDCRWLVRCRKQKPNVYQY